MPHLKSLEVGILNIVTQPHSPKNYARLWLAACSLRRAVKVHGDTYGLLATAHQADEANPTSPISGDIYRFTNIDETADWFDLARNEALDPKTAASRITIPRELKPNSRALRYVFFPEQHRLVFTTRLQKGTLSPKMAEVLVARSLADDRIAQLAPQLEVTVEQCQEQLAQILAKLSLTRLTIRIKVPNPDGSSALQARLMRGLRDENVRDLEETRTAVKNGSIKPSENTVALAKLAMSNGSVSGEGYDSQGDKKPFDTEEHPVRVALKKPGQVPFLDWFIDAARNVLRRKLNL